MALRPYEDIIGPLVIPVRGKEYTLPTISLQDGLRMRSAADGGEVLTVEDLTKIILGDAQQQMLDDGVPLAVIDRAFWAGVYDYRLGREAAEGVWENGVPKAVLEELVTVLTPTLLAAASTTPPPASGSTTKPKRPASRGRKSSPTGS